MFISFQAVVFNKQSFTQLLEMTILSLSRLFHSVVLQIILLINVFSQYLIYIPIFAFILYSHCPQCPIIIVAPPTTIFTQGNVSSSH